ncbi:MAG: imidazole glycerol phosphate synthase subunit HisH [Actinomycetota bacterium]
MARMRVAVLDYGMGNLASAAKALERAGAEVCVTADPSEVRRRGALVVPGVGAFGACMANLAAAGGVDLVREWIGQSRPLLGICLGMQTLFASSEEDDGAGLGVLEGKVAKLPGGPGLKVPHMGWNEVRPRATSRLFAGIDEDSRFYFVHSYYAVPSDPAVEAASCQYGISFTAAIERGMLFATQFHPEKSGDVGAALLSNFLEACR